uniref:Neur_chan_memb domain-containing protein n=1 Tax=Heterorhabditis bacteriophora TaxID=37862 RepID=A0A1I7WRM6_HETBA
MFIRIIACLLCLLVIMEAIPSPNIPSSIELDAVHEDRWGRFIDQRKCLCVKYFYRRILLTNVLQNLESLALLNFMMLVINLYLPFIVIIAFISSYNL